MKRDEHDSHGSRLPSWHSSLNETAQFIGQQRKRNQSSTVFYRASSLIGRCFRHFEWLPCEVILGVPLKSNAICNGLEGEESNCVRQWHRSKFTVDLMSIFVQMEPFAGAIFHLFTPPNPEEIDYWDEKRSKIHLYPSSRLIKKLPAFLFLLKPVVWILRMRIISFKSCSVCQI